MGFEIGWLLPALRRLRGSRRGESVETHGLPSLLQRPRQSPSRESIASERDGQSGKGAACSRLSAAAPGLEAAARGGPTLVADQAPVLDPSTSAIGHPGRAASRAHCVQNCLVGAGGRCSGSRSGRRGCGARRGVCGPRTRVPGCSASGNGIPLTGRGRCGSSSGSGSGPLVSDDPGSTAALRKSTSGASATSSSPQPSAINTGARLPCWLTALGSSISQGTTMQMTNAASRTPNRERRRSDRSRRELTRTPSGIAASERTMTTPMRGD